MNIFKKRELVDIVASFKKIVTELDALIATKLAQSEENAKKIAELTEVNKTLQAEVTQADSVRQNINNLIGD